MTDEDLQVEYWANYYADNPKEAESEVVDEEFDLEAELAEADRMAGELDDFEDVSDG